MRGRKGEPQTKEEVKKMDSYEDIGRQELEEGKTSTVSDFIIRSPNI